MSHKCIKDSALVAASMSEAGPRELDRILRHLAVCSRCALRFDVLRKAKKDLRPEIESFVGGVDASRAGTLLRAAALERLSRLQPSPPSSPPPASRAFFLSFNGLKLASGLFAMLLIALGAGYFAVYKPLVRSETRSPLLNLELIAPVGRLTVIPDIFRWTPVLHAEDYSIEVFDESLARVFGISAYLVNELVLPADMRAKLVTGKTYLWTVSARDGSSTLLTTRSASFVIE